MISNPENEAPLEWPTDEEQAAENEEKLNDVISLALGGDEQASKQILEAFGQDDNVKDALIDFMSGFATGTSPTLPQIKYNQQLGTLLFKCIADYVVRD